MSQKSGSKAFASRLALPENFSNQQMAVLLPFLTGQEKIKGYRF
ncbi:MAG TPA: hypothetical protein VL485_24760 [Ktedonobacteraceae bacterium]|nr:hypothetical protein [Ktedonobacteraceae bacterium]